MSQVNFPKPAKLIVGFFLHDKKLINVVTKDLQFFFGPIDLISRWITFDQTGYYEREMSAPLYRRILVFKDLIEQSELAKFKVITNGLEKKYSKFERRLINIDPGYLLAERFVLATGKNYAHRIYIGRGMYADLTLVYRDRGFQKLPWTYPDYAENYIKKFLVLVRSKYISDLRLINLTRYEH